MTLAKSIEHKLIRCFFGGAALLISLVACSGDREAAMETTAVPAEDTIVETESEATRAGETAETVPSAATEPSPQATAVTPTTEEIVMENNIPESWHPSTTLGTSFVDAVDISPDGNTALLGSTGFITIVNLNDLSSRQIFIDGTQIEYLSFLPNNQHFIVGYSYAPPAMIDSFTGEVVQTFRGMNYEPLALSPDGTKLAGVGGSLPTIEIWDIASNQRLIQLEGHTNRITSLAFSPDGTRLVSTDENSFNPGAWVWDVVSGEQLMFLPHEDSAETSAFSPDGKYIATGTKLWDATTGEELNTLDRFWGDSFVIFSPDSQLLAVIEALGGTTLVDIATWEPLYGVVYGSNGGNQADFSPNGQTLLLGTQLIDVASGTEISDLGNQPFSDSITVMSSDGMFAATTGYDPMIRIWDIGVGTVRYISSNVEDYSLYTIAFSPDGNKLLASNGVRLIMWDAITGDEIINIEITSGTFDTFRLGMVGFTPDGTRFFKAENAVNLILRDAATGDVLQNFDHGDAQVSTVAFAPNGKTVVTGSHTLGGAFIRWWNATTGEMLSEHTLEPGSRIDTVAFSPNGSQVISLENDSQSRDDTILRVWDAATGEEVNAISLSDKCLSAAYFPDGRQLVVGGERETVIIDTLTGEILEKVTGEGDAVYFTGVRQVMVSNDGKRILLETSRTPVIYEKNIFVPLTD